MPDYVKIFLAFVVGGIVMLGAHWTFSDKHPQMHRSEDGIVLGGYILPDTLGRLRTEAVRRGFDGTLFDIRVEECSASTVWDVSSSGVAVGADLIEFADGEGNLILRYQTSQSHGFLYPMSVQYFTSVYVDDVQNTGCVVEALTEIFQHAQPVFSVSVPFD